MSRPMADTPKRRPRRQFDDKFKAQAQVVRLSRNADQANDLVTPFGFTYCKFNPSRFT